jgi:hypothetical protein
VEENFRLSRNAKNKHDVVYIPRVRYVKAESGSVELGMDRETVDDLHHYLGEWLGVFEADEAEDARLLADEGFVESLAQLRVDPEGTLAKTLDGELCATCGHADAHDGAGIGVCRAKSCGCDGPVAENAKPTAKDVLHLCDRCHGEVYTFPTNLVSLGQRLLSRTDRWASFTYTDHGGDELLISDDIGPKDGEVGVHIVTPPDGVYIPLNALEAVVDAIRVSGLRAVEANENE